MIDFILDNIVIVGFIAIGVGQWLKATFFTKDEPQETPTADDYNFEEFDGVENAETFEEFQQRTAPQAAQPPPLTQVRNTSPQVMMSAPQAELDRQETIKKQLRAARQQKSAQRQIDYEASFAKPKPNLGSLRYNLSNNRELKRAFIVKEVLDKPIGLR